MRLFGSPKFLTHPYVRVASLHPGQPIVCMRSFLLQWLQASPLSEGWPSAALVYEAESSSLIAATRTLAAPVASTQPLLAEPDRLLTVERAIYSLTTFRSVNEPSLTWRTETTGPYPAHPSPS